MSMFGSSRSIGNHHHRLDLLSSRQTLGSFRGLLWPSIVCSDNKLWSSFIIPGRRIQSRWNECRVINKGNFVFELIHNNRINASPLSSSYSTAGQQQGVSNLQQSIQTLLKMLCFISSAASSPSSSSSRRGLISTHESSYLNVHSVQWANKIKSLTGDLKRWFSYQHEDCHFWLATRKLDEHLKFNKARAAELKHKNQPPRLMGFIRRNQRVDTLTDHSKNVFIWALESLWSIG